MRRARLWAVGLALALLGGAGCGGEDQIRVTLVRAGDGDPLGAASSVEVSIYGEDPTAPALSSATFLVGESGSLSGRIAYGSAVRVVARGLSAGGDVVALGGTRDLVAPAQSGTPFDAQLFIAAVDTFYSTKDAESGQATGPDSGLPGLSVTRLSDGQVLIAGGSEIDGDGNITAISQSAYVYDPDTGLYRRLASGLANPRAYHTATALRGRPSSVLLCGGLTIVNNQIVSAATCEVFDPAAERFSLVPTPMVLPRVGHAAVLLPDGRVLLSGGADVAKISLPCADCGRDDLILATVHDQAEAYDPEARTLTGISKRMGARRAFHTALRANKNGRVLLVGGEDDAGSTLTSTEVFAPDGNAFSSGPDLDVARTRHAAARLPNDDVCVFGGLADRNVLSSTVDSYECFTIDAFGGGTKTPAAPMFAARRDHCAAALSTGQVLLFGGFGPDGDSLATAELDAPGSTSAQAGVPAKARGLLGCVALGTGGPTGWEAVFVVGGVETRGGLWTSQPSGEVYTP